MKYFIFSLFLTFLFSACSQQNTNLGKEFTLLNEKSLWISNSGLVSFQQINNPSISSFSSDQVISVTIFESQKIKDDYLVILKTSSKIDVAVVIPYNDIPFIKSTFSKASFL